MPKKKLPIGISDFKRVIDDNLYFVDKSLLIKEIIANNTGTTLIPRPRRFGKTLNLSMLRYFFEKTDKSNRHLFDGLKISHDRDSMTFQGNYPVIFLTFKDVKQESWEDCYAKMRQLIAYEFMRHDYLRSSNVLNDIEQGLFESVRQNKAEQTTFEDALKNLTAYLYRYHEIKPIILIDEYDAPIHEGYVRGYYEKIIPFMRNLLCGGLKDNDNPTWCVVTGILRIAKESIFSGLNNLKVCTFLNELYSDKFGLQEEEVVQLLDYYGLPAALDDVRTWYNGYTSGLGSVYNPWSIINFADSKGTLAPYWVNTSDNAIIRDLIRTADDQVKEDFESLIQHQTINKQLDEHIVFADIETKTTSLWNFLLFTGYLTFTKQERIGRRFVVDLRIPNDEVLSLFENIISGWFDENFNLKRYHQMLQSLTRGDTEAFADLFTNMVTTSLSAFDVGGNEPERFYHALVLGMLVALEQTHEIKSNRESGFGRYDVMVIPRDTSKVGVIIEFKKVRSDKEETLGLAVDAALKQIDEKQYEVELRNRGINNVIKLGIAFEAKKTLVKAG